LLPLLLSEIMSDANSLVLWTLGAGVGVAAALIIYLLVLRGRRVPGEHVFRASRWSRGNHVFPTQVAVTPTSVVHYTPEWFGRRDQSIHMAHVASVLVDTNLFFSNVMIESSGGASPVRCHGHRKRDAIRMKELIEQYQTAYYASPQASRQELPPQGKR
jgi:hypothetical protein